MSIAVAALPGDDEIGAQGGDCLQVHLAVASHLRQRCGLGREVAEGHHANHLRASASRKQQLSDMRRKADDALRRALEANVFACIVGDLDRSVSGLRQRP